MRFSDKKVFITGASRGIGAEIAAAFRAEGAYVIGTKTSNDIIADDLCDDWFIANFSSESQILMCADYLRSQDVDILVNNAGFNINNPFTEIDLDIFKKILGMDKKGWGRIVNISSIFGKIGKEGRAAYSASKFALDGLTLSISAEYSSRGIMANCIAPGFIDTSLTRKMLTPEEISDLVSRVPAGRLGQVNEISNLVLWLSSEENTFTTGQNIAIDGGFTRV